MGCELYCRSITLGTFPMAGNSAVLWCTRIKALQGEYSMKYQHLDPLVHCWVISLILVACAPQRVILPTATSTPNNIAEKIDIGVRGLYLLCLGAGNPTVILDTGLGDTSLIWASVNLEVQKFTRVCAYDRAGLGKSDPASKPRT